MGEAKADSILQTRYLFTSAGIFPLGRFSFSKNVVKFCAELFKNGYFVFLFQESRKQNLKTKALTQRGY